MNESVPAHAPAPMHTPAPTKARRLSFDLAASWALALTVALAAVVYFPSSIVPIAYIKVALLAIGTLISLVLYILARLTRGNVIVPPLPLLGALWLVPLAYGLSSIFSGVNAMKAFFGHGFDTDTFGFVLLLALIGSLAALAMRRPEHYKSFFKVSALAAGLVVVVQILIVLYAKTMPNTLSPLTTLPGSFTDLGMITGLAVVLDLIALRFLSFGKRTKLMLTIGLVLGLIVTAFVNSLLVWVLVGLSGLGLFIESVMRRKIVSDDEDLEGVSTLTADVGIENGKHGGIMVLPLVTIIVSLFFIIGNSTIGTSFVNAVGTSIIDARPSLQSTFDVGSHVYASSPVFGSGPNTFGEQWLKFRDRSINDTVFWSVDFPTGVGYIPTAFVALGALGALAWIAFILLVLFFGLRALLLRASSDRFTRFVSIASFIGSVYVLTLALFTVPGPVVLAAGFALIGVFVSSLRFGQNRAEWGVIFAKSPRVGFVIVFLLTIMLLGSVLSAYVVTERYLAVQAYGDAAAALASGNLDAADAAITRSQLFGASDRAYQLAASSGIAHMNKIAQDTTLPAATAQQQFQAALSGAIQNASAATKLNPNDYQNWAVLGSVYQTVVPLNIEGAYKNAKDAYDHAMLLNPTNAVLPYIVAQLDIAGKNNAAAENDLVKAINLKHDYTQAIFLLSQLEVQQGKAREALQAAEAAAYFAPNDPTVLFQVGILRSGNGDTAGAILALARAVELNPQYANAHFFLGVMYAIQGTLDKATAEMEKVASFSEDNAKAVASDLAALKSGRNPFPPSRLGALGIPQKVTEPAAGAKPAAAAAK